MNNEKSSVKQKDLPHQKSQPKNYNDDNNSIQSLETDSEDFCSCSSDEDIYSDAQTKDSSIYSGPQEKELDPLPLNNGADPRFHKPFRNLYSPYYFKEELSPDPTEQSCPCNTQIFNTQNYHQHDPQYVEFDQQYDYKYYLLEQPNYDLEQVSPTQDDVSPVTKPFNDKAYLPHSSNVYQMRQDKNKLDQVYDVKPATESPDSVAPEGIAPINIHEIDSEPQKKTSFEDEKPDYKTHHEIFRKSDTMHMDGKPAIAATDKKSSEVIRTGKDIPNILIPRSHLDEELNYVPNIHDTRINEDACVCNKKKFLTKTSKDSPWDFPATTLAQKQWSTIPYNRKTGEQGTIADLSPHTEDYNKKELKTQDSHLTDHSAKDKEMPRLVLTSHEPKLYDPKTGYDMVRRVSLEPKAKGKKFKPHYHKRKDSLYQTKRDKKNAGPVYDITTATSAMPTTDKKSSEVIRIDKDIPKTLIPRSHLDKELFSDSNLDDTCISKDVCACDKNNIVIKTPKHSSWDFPATTLAQKQWSTIPYNRKTGEQGTIADLSPHTEDYNKKELKTQDSQLIDHSAKDNEMPRRILISHEPKLYDPKAGYDMVRRDLLEPKAKGKKFKPHYHKRKDSFYQTKRDKKNAGPGYDMTTAIKPFETGLSPINVHEIKSKPQDTTSLKAVKPDTHHEISPTSNRMHTDGKSAMPTSDGISSEIIRTDKNIPKTLIPRSHLDEELVSDSNLDDTCISKDVCACDKNNIVIKTSKHSSWDFPANTLAQKQWSTIPYDRKTGQQGTIADLRPHTEDFNKEELKTQDSKPTDYPAKGKEMPRRVLTSQESKIYDPKTGYDMVRRVLLEPKAKGKKFKPHYHKRKDSFYQTKRDKKNTGPGYDMTTAIKPFEKGLSPINVHEIESKPQETTSFKSVEPDTHHEISPTSNRMHTDGKSGMPTTDKKSSEVIRTNKDTPKTLIPRNHLDKELVSDSNLYDTCISKDVCACDKNNIVIKKPKDSSWDFPAATLAQKQWSTIPYNRKTGEQGTIADLRPHTEDYNKKELKTQDSTDHSAKDKEMPRRILISHEPKLYDPKTGYDMVKMVLLEPKAKGKKFKPHYHKRKDSFYQTKRDKKKSYQVYDMKPSVEPLEKRVVPKTLHKIDSNSQAQAPYKDEEQDYKTHREIITKSDRMYTDGKSAMPTTDEKSSQMIRTDKDIPKMLIPRSHIDKELVSDSNLDDTCISKNVCACDKNNIVIKKPKDSSWEFPAATLAQKQWSTIPYDRKTGQQGTIADLRPVTEDYKKEEEQKDRSIYHFAQFKVIPKLIPTLQTLYHGPKSYDVVRRKSLERETKGKKFKPYGYKRRDSFYRYERDIERLDKVYDAKTGPLKLELWKKQTEDTEKIPSELQVEKREKMIKEKKESEYKIDSSKVPETDGSYKYIKETTESKQVVKKVTLAEEKLIISEKLDISIATHVESAYKYKKVESLKPVAEQPMEQKRVIQLSKEKPERYEKEKTVKVIKKPKYEQAIRVKLLKEKPLFANKLKASTSKLVRLDGKPAKLILNKVLDEQKNKNAKAGESFKYIIKEGVVIRKETRILENITRSNLQEERSKSLPIIKSPVIEIRDSFYRYEKEIQVPFYETAIITKLETNNLEISTKLKPARTERIEAYEIEDKTSLIEPVYIKATESKLPKEKPKSLPIITSPDLKLRDSFHKFQKKDFEKDVYQTSPKLESHTETIYQKPTTTKLLNKELEISSKIPPSIIAEIETDSSKPQIEFKNLKITNLDHLKYSFNTPIEPINFIEERARKIDSYYCFEELEKQIIKEEPIFHRANITRIYEKPDFAEEIKQICPTEVEQLSYQTIKKTKLIVEKEQKLNIIPVRRVESFYRYEKKLTERDFRNLKFNIVKLSNLNKEASHSYTKIMSIKSNRIYNPFKFDSGMKSLIDLQKPNNSVKMISKLPLGGSALDSKMKTQKPTEIAHKKYENLATTRKNEDTEAKIKPVYDLSKKSKTMLQPESLIKRKETPFDRVDSFYKYEPIKDQIPVKKPVLEEVKIKLVKGKPLTATKIKVHKSTETYLATKHKKEDTQSKTKPIFDLSKKSKTVLQPESLFKIKATPFDRVDSFYKFLPRKDQIPVTKPVLEEVKIKLVKDKPLTASKIKVHKSTETYFATKHKKEDTQTKTKPIFDLSKKSKTVLQPESLVKIKETPFDRVDSFYKYEQRKDQIPVKKLVLEDAKVKLVKDKPLTASKIKGHKYTETYLATKHKKEDTQSKTKPIFDLSKKSKTVLEPESLVKIKETPFDRVDSFYKYEPKRDQIPVKKPVLEDAKVKLAKDKPLTASKIKGHKSTETYLATKYKKEDTQSKTKPIFDLSKKSKTVLEPESLVKIKETPFDRVDSFYKYEPRKDQIPVKKPVLEDAKVKLAKDKPLTASKIKGHKSNETYLATKHKKEDTQSKTKPIFDLSKKSKTVLEPESLVKIKETPFDRVDSFYKYEPRKDQIPVKKPVLEDAKVKLAKDKPLTASKIKGHKSTETYLATKHKKEDTQSKTKPIFDLSKKSKIMLQPESLVKIKETPFDRVDSFYKYEPRKDQIPVKKLVLEDAKVKLVKDKPLTASKIKGHKSTETYLATKHKKEDTQTKTKPIFDLSKKSKTVLEPESLVKIKETPFDRVDSFYKYEPRKDHIPVKKPVLENAKVKLVKDKPLTATKIKGHKSTETYLATKHKKEDTQSKTKPIFDLSKKSKTMLQPESLVKIKETPFDRVDSFYKYEPRKDHIPVKKPVLEDAKVKLVKDKPLTASKIKGHKSTETYLARKHKEEDTQSKTKQIFDLSKKSKTMLQPESLVKIKETPFDRVDSFYKYEPRKDQIPVKKAVLEDAKVKLAKDKPLTASKIKGHKSNETYLATKHKKEDTQSKTKPIFDLSKKSKTVLEPESLVKIKETPFDRVDSFYKYEPRKDQIPVKKPVLEDAKVKLAKDKPLTASKIKGHKSTETYLATKHKKEDTQSKTKPIFDLSKKSKIMLQPESLVKIKETPFDRVDSFYKYEPRKDQIPVKKLVLEDAKVKLVKDKPLTASKIKGHKSTETYLATKHKKEDTQTKTKPIFDLSKKSKTVLEPESLVKIKETPFDRVDSFYKYEPRKDHIPVKKPVLENAKVKLVKDKPLTATKIKGHKSTETYLATKHKKEDTQSKTKPIFDLSKKSKTMLQPESLVKIKETPFDRVDSFYKYEPRKDHIPVKKPVLEDAKVKLVKDKPLTASKIKGHKSTETYLARKHKEEDTQKKTKQIFDLSKKSKTMLQPESLVKIKETPFDRVDSFYKYEPRKDHIPGKKPVLEDAKLKLVKDKPLTASKIKGHKSTETYLATKHKKEDAQSKTKPIFDLSKKLKTVLEPESLVKIKETPFDRVDSFYKYEPRKDHIPVKKPVLADAKVKLVKDKPLTASKIKGHKSTETYLATKHKKEDAQTKTKPIFDLSKKSKTVLEPESLVKIKETPFDRVDSFYKYEPRKDQIPVKKPVLEDAKVKLVKDKPLTASKIKGHKSTETYLATKHKKEDAQSKTKPIFDLSKKSKTVLEPESLVKIKETPFDRVDSFYKYEPRKDQIPVKKRVLEYAKVKLVKDKPLTASKIKGHKSTETYLATKHEKEDTQTKTKPIFDLSKKSKTVLEPESLVKIKVTPFDRVDSFYMYEPRKDHIPVKKPVLEDAKVKLVKDKPLTTSKIKGPKSTETYLATKHKKEDTQTKTKPIFDLSKKLKTVLEPESLVKIKETPFDRVDSFYKYEPRKGHIPVKKPVLADAKVKLVKDKPLTASKIKGHKSTETYLATKHKKEDAQTKTKPIFDLSKKSKTVLEPESLVKIKETPFDRVDSFYKYEPRKDQIPVKKPVLEDAKVKLVKDKPLTASKIKGHKSTETYLATKHKKEDAQSKTKPIFDLSKKSKTVLEPESLVKIKETPFDRVDSFYKYEPRKDHIPVKKPVLENAKVKLVKDKPLTATKIKGHKSTETYLATKHKKEDAQSKTKPIFDLSKKSKTVLEPESLVKIKETPFDRVDSFYKYEPRKDHIPVKKPVLEDAKVKLVKDKPLTASKIKRHKSTETYLATKHKKEDTLTKTKPIFDLSKKSKTVLEPESLVKIKETPFDRVDSFYKYEPRKDQIPVTKPVLEDAKVKLVKDKPLTASKIKGHKATETYLATKHKKKDTQTKTKPIFDLSKKSRTMLQPESLVKIKGTPFDRVDSFYKYEPRKDQIPVKKPVLEDAKVKLVKDKPLTASKIKGHKSTETYFATKHKKEDTQIKTKPIFDLTKKSKTMLQPESLVKIKETPFDHVDSFYKYEPRKDQIPVKKPVLEDAKIKLVKDKPLTASKIKGHKSNETKLATKQEDTQPKTKPIFDLSKVSKTMLEPESLVKIKETPFDRVDSFYKYEPRKDQIPVKKPVLEDAKTKLVKDKPLTASKIKVPKSTEIYLATKYKKEDTQTKTKPIFDLTKKSKTVLEPDSLVKIKETPFDRIDSFYKYEPRKDQIPVKKPVLDEAKIKLVKDKPLTASKIKGHKSNETYLATKHKKEDNQTKIKSVYELSKKSKTVLEPESLVKIKETPFDRVDSFYKYEPRKDQTPVKKPVLVDAKVKLVKDKPLIVTNIKGPKSKNIVIDKNPFKSVDDSGSHVKTSRKKLQNFISFKSSDKSVPKPIYDLANLTKIRLPVDKPNSLSKTHVPRFERVESFYKFERKVSDNIVTNSIYETAIRSKIPKEKSLSATPIKRTNLHETDIFYMYEKEIKVINYEKATKSKRSFDKANSYTDIRQTPYELAFLSQLPIEQAEFYEKINLSAKKVDSSYQNAPPKSQDLLKMVYPKTPNVISLHKGVKHIPKQEALPLDSADYIFNRVSILHRAETSALHWRILHMQIDSPQPEFGTEFDADDNVWINTSVYYQRIAYSDARMAALLNDPDLILPPANHKK